MSVELPDWYEAAFRRAVLDCAQLRLRGEYQSTITAFWPNVAVHYDGDLMVVGRSVNGWVTPGVRTRTPDIEPHVRALCDEAIERGKHSMEWVTKKRLRSSSYRPRRSQFWAVTHRVAEGLLGPRWFDRIVWSNLYKVAPAAGYNPGKALRRGQRAAVRSLFVGEVRALRPRRLLLLTGWQWAEPFLEELGLDQERPPSRSLIEAVGMIDRCRVVVLPHPQGRKLTPLVEAASAQLSPA